MSLQNQFKKAVKDSGSTLAAVAKGAGIVYPVLYRFVNGERDLTLTTATKLADYFGMRLTCPKRPKKERQK